MLAVIVLAGGLYLFPQSINNGSDTNTEPVVVEPITVERLTEGTITRDANGWSEYSSSEWGLTFAYPTSWSLTEQAANTAVTGESGLATVGVAGDMYSVDFSTLGKEFPRGPDDIAIEYTISGKKVQGYETKIGAGFLQTLHVCGVGMTVSGSESSKITTDKIIESVKCAE